MNFFKRKDRDEQKPVEQESQPQEVAAAPAEGGINFIIEDTTDNTPGRRDARILNSTQLQRVKDAK